MRKHRTLLTAAVLLAFAFSAVPAAAAPANQVPGEKKYCLSTKASHTFLNASGSSQLKYKVTVAPKLCLFYTNVKNTVSGKSVTQPLVHSYSYDVRVSHSGYLPADASGKAVLPDGLGSDNSPPRFAFSVNFLEPATSNLFNVYHQRPSDDLYTDFLNTGGAQAWASLVEAGFTCSKGKCRPVKSSAAETFSSAAARPLDASTRYVLVLQADIANKGITSSVAFWDHGTAPVVAAGISRPQNPFKREKLGFVEGFCGSGTYLGVPAASRDKDGCQ